MDGLTRIIVRLFNSLHLPLNLFTVLVSYIFIVSFVALVAYAEQWMSTTLQQAYTHQQRSQLYRALVQSSWSFFLQQKKARLLHNLTTQIQSISAANFHLITLLNNGILLGVYLTLALILSWKMTLIAVLSAVLLLGIILPLQRYTSLAGRDHLELNQKIFQIISEQLDALKMIKVSGFEEPFIQETKHVSASLEDQNRRLTQVLAASKLLYSVGSVIIFSFLLYMALMVLNLPLTSLMLLLVVFSRILPRVSTMQQSYQRIIHQLPAYSDVKQVLYESMEHQEELQSTPQETLSFNHAISFNKVSFSYQENNVSPIIRALSFRIKKNTTTAIIGPSGAGKSTLADLIVGLIEPSSGQIYIDSTLLEDKHQLAWRKSVAYVTQDPFLLNTSIRHNVRLFCPQACDEAVWDVLRATAADGFVARLEQGLDTIIGDSGVSLSGGERQRIALARALLCKPQLLVLDESTNALDKETISLIQKTLAQLRGTMTLLIISHQIEMSAFADQKIVLEACDVKKILEPVPS